MSLSQAAWIEALPVEIAADELCKKSKIDFDFTHIECVDNYLFLWKDGYSKILKIHLETKEISPIILPPNIKIFSLKIISKNNKQYLFIAENKLRPHIYLINVNEPSIIKPFSYHSFSSRIIQIEFTTISSNTIYVLTHDNFKLN